MDGIADYFGTYFFMGVALNVWNNGELLVASVPGVPQGYEIVFESAGQDRFYLRGSQFDGSSAAFIRNVDGDVTAMRVGPFELAKIPEENIHSLQVVARYPAPQLNLPAEKEAVFKSVYREVIEKADGSWINYDLPYALHEFVQYVSAQDAVIFHGSNNSDIQIFEPVRKSYELRDETGRGNLQAVYGTHDGLWAMFFAIVDRPKLRGSIRNGVMYFHNLSGQQLAVYNFSINREQLAEKPWREGALYLLPRATFERLKLTDHSYANEWASQMAVKPLARLRIRPVDFPFLNQIGGHDDSELLRLGVLSKLIHDSALHVEMQEDRFSIILPSSIENEIGEYITLQREYLPSATITCTPSGDKLALTINGLPPAFRQSLISQYADRLAS